jgi:hypothetical protein
MGDIDIHLIRFLEADSLIPILDSVSLLDSLTGLRRVVSVYPTTHARNVLTLWIWLIPRVDMDLAIL